MSRDTTMIRVTLTISGRWAVGGVPVPGKDIDLPLLVDPRCDGPDGGRPHVPGASLAGSLKRHLKHLGTEWLGSEPPDREERTGTVEATPSRLSLLGTSPVEASIGSRGATAVDGERGAAQAHTLRFEQWAAPTTLLVAMQHEGAADPRLLAALASWRPHVGRGRTSGLGSAQVDVVEHVTVDLAETDQLQWWLTERATWLRGEAAAPPGSSSGELAGTSVDLANKLVLSWRVEEPVHIGWRPSDEGRAKQTTATLTLRAGERLLIPGSSWKGVFRHRVEAILSVLGIPEIEVAALLGYLFGSLEGGRGVLAFSDSYAEEGVTLTRSHVAIDRFTGGAQDGLLYSVEAIAPGATLDLTIGVHDGVGEAVVGLLWHVARDLHDGLIGVGGHSTRGYGSVTLTSPPDDLAPVDVAALRELAA